MAEPVYVTIADGYTRQIRDGTLPTGARLPSQADLIKQHGASRTVIRRAIELLRVRQLVRTVPRHGTFVIAHSPTTSTPSPETPTPEPDVDEIRAVTHPIRRAQLAASLITHYQLRIAELSGIRQTAIADAHDQGMPLTAIAEHLGLTAPLPYQ